MNEIYDYLKNGGTTLRVVPRLSIKEQVLTFPSFDISLPIVSNGGGYGALYNWFCTQNQLKSITNGYLYNWYAATDSRNIAPVGFHVPTLAEWGILKTYVGGYLVAGQKLKESNPLYWVLNTGTNVFNFNTRGSASRNVVGFGNLNSEFFYFEQ